MVSGFPTLAVVGAGQLARMMVPPAVALGVDLRVLARTPAEPAAQVARHVAGDADRLADLRALADGADVVTFEHELVRPAHLAALEAEGAVLRPGGAALAHGRDKLAMRRRLAELGVPGPRWREAASPADVAAFGDEAGWPVVVKRATGGYDGRGVAVVGADEARRALGDPAQAGWAAWFGAPKAGGVLVEERVAFARELAVLVARSPSGQASLWPVVETVQRGGICREVLAPAPGLDPEVAAEAALTAARVAGGIGAVGVLAVEGFEVPAAGGDGPRFLVNELALRPHNSGHWTIDAAVTDQFENHVRAVLDLPLGDVTATAPATAMVNVIGAEPPDLHTELYPAYLHVMAHDPAARVHVYRKDVRPGRKVGHVTVSAATHAEALERARHAAGFIAGTVRE